MSKELAFSISENIDVYIKYLSKHFLVELVEQEDQDYLVIKDKHGDDIDSFSFVLVIQDLINKISCP